MDKNACPIFFRQYFPFWDKLTPAQQDTLCSATHSFSYTKGENVHGTGSCTGVIVIETGCLRGYLLSEEGREVTLFRAYPGEVIILSAPCALKQEGISFDLMIDAEEDSSLLIVEGSSYARVSSENIYAETFTLRQTAARLSDAVWVMQQILFMRFDRRLAAFLLEESARQGTRLSLTHDQIARYMGTAREVVTRMLRYFTAEKIIRQGRGVIELTDVEKLKEYVE